MNHIDPMFSHDYFKFVLQEQTVIKTELPSDENRFSLKSKEKNKKTVKKENSPWIPKKSKKKSEEEEKEEKEEEEEETK